MICVFCNSKKVIKHGFQSGKQRYRCKDCKKVFCETSTGLSYSRSEKRLLSMLLNMLENDFYEQPGLSDDYDEDNLYWHIESDDTLQDIVTWDQADIDTGIDIGINNDSIPTIPNINDNFDMGLDPVENFSLELTPNAF